jgi:hypothetical protein
MGGRARSGSGRWGGMFVSRFCAALFCLSGCGWLAVVGAGEVHAAKWDTIIQAAGWWYGALGCVCFFRRAARQTDRQTRAGLGLSFFFPLHNKVSLPAVGIARLRAQRRWFSESYMPVCHFITKTFLSLSFSQQSLFDIWMRFWFGTFPPSLACFRCERKEMRFLVSIR